MPIQTMTVRTIIADIAPVTHSIQWGALASMFLPFEIFVIGASQD
ncbi:hypothetical protein GCM10010924_38380 [Rhizobium wenxiniae]|nr:hypothetical protein GCM10010924_38380 [Rhizobium wenxiniae]